MKHLTLFLVLIFINSCAFHSGLMTSTPQPLAINKKYVDVAVGYSKTSYFIGIGGLGKDMLINEAKRNLLLSSQMKPNQSLENVTLNMKKTIYGPYIKLEAIMMADIAENDSTFTTTYSDNYSNLMNLRNYSYNYYYINPGENILFKDSKLPAKRGKIVSLESGKVKIFYVEHNGNHKIVSLPYNKVFKINDFELLQSKLGLIKKETYNFSAKNYSGYQVKGEGKIIGLNKNYALIKDEKTDYFIDIQTLKIMNLQ